MSRFAAMEADAIVLASRDLLGQGDAVGAERLLSPLLAQHKTDPAIQHLMGQIKQALRQPGAAEAHLRAAVAHGLSEPRYYHDLGALLLLRGAHEEAARVFRAALALNPSMHPARAGLVRCLLAGGDLTQAEAEARRHVEALPGAESWTLLGSVQQTQERWHEALESAQRALALGPGLRGLRFNCAKALDRVGRAEEALEAYDRLTAEELDSIDLATTHARALYAAGRANDAEALLETAVERWPASAVLHALLARVRWLRGEGERCTEAIEGEIARRPRELGLRLACADALHRGGHPEKAARVLYEALRLAPDSPGLASAYGIVLGELGRAEDGLQMLRRAYNLAPDAAAKRNMLSTLLRAGRGAEALEIARELRQADGEEQYLIACEAMALRLLGRAERELLCDHQKMVRAYDIAAPRGYFTMANFNAALAETLRVELERVNPLDRQAPNCWQSARDLAQVDEPVLRAFRSAAGEAVRDYISRFPADPAHPLYGRKRERVRIAELRAVRFGDGGALPAQVQDRGWIGGFYRVASAAAERASDPYAGWLHFGAPRHAPLAPELWLEARPGRLVLFPSYFWHGAAPFEGAESLALSLVVAPA